MAKAGEEVTVNKDDLREIIREEFNNALTSMGFDVTEPVESQQDMAFLRDFRKTTESVRRKSLLTIVGLFVSGLVAALWMGLQEAFSKIPH